MPGTLYIVSTPIGNLQDMTLRAIETLKNVDIIFAEDTRVTKRLLDHYGVRHKKLISYHEHNESQRVESLESYLEQSLLVALVSDAGTPLISDPGYQAVSVLRKKGFEVVPIPGASALVAAMSASGFAADRFQYMGFPSHKSSQRTRFFEDVKEIMWGRLYFTNQCID